MGGESPKSHLLSPICGGTVLSDKILLKTEDLSYLTVNETKPRKIPSYLTVIETAVSQLMRLP
jgi:hypothetical protein